MSFFSPFLDAKIRIDIEMAILFFALPITAAEAGSVLVAAVRLLFIGRQDDLDFPVRGILDGTDRETEVGFYSNVHFYRYLMWK